MTTLADMVDVLAGLPLIYHPGHRGNTRSPSMSWHGWSKSSAARLR
jgi:hypothetical protein